MGHKVFEGLHTTVNEYNEIVGMVLTQHKGHDQIAPALMAINRAAESFGHTLPQVVYTDSVRADRRAYEQYFPSLFEGVVSMPQPGNLPLLKLPASWRVVHLTSATQVNIRFNNIMATHSATHPVVVGLALSWPVDTQSGIHGRVALIQIAYEQTVFLIQVCSLIPMWLHGSLPKVSV